MVPLPLTLLMMVPSPSPAEHLSIMIPILNPVVLVLSRPPLPQKLKVIAALLLFPAVAMEQLVPAFPLLRD